MAIGALIRDLRLARGWSQDDLTDRLNDLLPKPTLTRSDVSRYESEKRLPSTDRLFDALSRALDVPETVLRSETKLSRVDRRAFLSLAALTVTHGSLAGEIYASIAASDGGPLATVQTGHGTDLVIASMVEPAVANKLNRWMLDGPDPVLRVNAAGILAKLPSQDTARQVASVLVHDDEVRQLYTTAVVSRVCSADWQAATRLVREPVAHPNAVWAARKFAAEALNPRDAGARWCAALMLRELSPALGGTT